MPHIAASIEGRKGEGGGRDGGVGEGKGGEGDGGGGCGGMVRVLCVRVVQVVWCQYRPPPRRNSSDPINPSLCGSSPFVVR